MYRSNWGTKKDQECILALAIYQSGFDALLEKVVLTSPDSASYTGVQWEKAFAETTVYCQWDPDRNMNGNAVVVYFRGISGKPSGMLFLMAISHCSNTILYM